MYIILAFFIISQCIVTDGFLLMYNTKTYQNGRHRVLELSSQNNENVKKSVISTEVYNNSQSGDANKNARHKIWQLRYNELKEYNEIHGNCEVPQKYNANPALGKWVSQQRVMYKKAMKNGERKIPTDSKKYQMIQALDEIGFIWDASKEKWSKRYNELKEYKNRHGHTLVPSSYKQNPALGKWVATQRRQYSLLQKEMDDNSLSNKKNVCTIKNPLTPERIEALNKIDFSWEMNSYGAISSYRWTKYFNQLCKYKEDNNGDTDVPLYYDANPKLGIWVHNQRYNYKAYMLNKVSYHDEICPKMKKKMLLDEKRIKKLKQIGFMFEKSKEKWNYRYEELKKYKKKYGDCMIPENYKKNPSLATWVTNQRKQYKYLESEEEIIRQKCTLTPERISKLNDIGFCWSKENENWNKMFEKLKAYHEKYNTFNIPSADVENLSLGSWVRYQRQQYRIYMSKKENINDDDITSQKNDLEINPFTSMTEARVQALNEIGFVWEGPRSRREKVLEGPSLDDWSLLFNKMKEKGINSQAKAKEHIFEGEERFVDGLAHRLDEDDLMSLWNEEDDDDDDLVWN